MEIAVLARVFVVFIGGHFTTVAEVVAFVDNDKIVVTPVDVFEVKTVALPGLTRKVGMIENIIAQAVSDKRIVDVVAAVSHPVLMQFLRAKNEN